MSAAETVLLIIMLALFYSIYALENRNVEDTKLYKHQNEDITLFCGLSRKHEEFNRNVTVTWYNLKVCKLCFSFTSNSLRNDEDWKIIDARGLILTLDDSNSSSGYYMCKIQSPYHVDYKTALQIEITKTFQVEVVDNSQVPHPELFNDTMFQFNVEMNSAVVLQCKCKSTKPVVIKWFKQKAVDEVDEPHSFNEIKYFENFYQPLPQVGLKMLDDNLYLSKLTISNVTEEVSLYACVCVSYSHRFSFRNFTIRAKKPKSLHDMMLDNDEEETELFGGVSNDDRFFELIFIPLIFLLLVIFQVSAIVYLLIYRRLLKYTNKNVILT